MASQVNDEKGENRNKFGMNYYSVGINKASKVEVGKDPVTTPVVPPVTPDLKTGLGTKPPEKKP